MSAHRIEAVVVGTSAGGVEALGCLVAALPADMRVAVIAVLHLPAERVSAVPEVLSHRSSVPVREARDKEPIETGVVYLAAPGCHLLVEPDRHLALSLDEPVNYSRPSIDVLFESAAYAYRERLLAIVMTGASADGALGTKTIRQFGGTAWVQDPGEALAATMPQACLDLAGADLVLPLQQLAHRLGTVSANGMLEGSH